MADKYLEDTYYLVQPHRNGNRMGGGVGGGCGTVNSKTCTRTHATTFRNAVTHASTHTDSRAHLYTDEFVHAQGTFYFRHGASPPNSPQYPAPARSFVLQISYTDGQPGLNYAHFCRYDVKSFVFRDRKECVRRLGEERNKNNGELLSNLAESLNNAGIDNIVGLIECNKYSRSEIKFWKINHIKSSSNEFGQFKILCVLFCISSISNLKQYAINIEARATLKQSSHSLWFSFQFQS